MSKAYPHFKPSYSHDELVEHFLLTPAELQFVLALRGDANRCGAALLLKLLPYLGYVPEALGQIPQAVRAFMAGQLGLLWDQSDGYPWHSSTRDHHLAQVRQFTGWRFQPRRTRWTLSSGCASGQPTRLTPRRRSWGFGNNGT